MMSVVVIPKKSTSFSHNHDRKYNRCLEAEYTEEHIVQVQTAYDN